MVDLSFIPASPQIMLLFRVFDILTLLGHALSILSYYILL